MSDDQWSNEGNPKDDMKFALETIRSNDIKPLDEYTQSLIKKLEHVLDRMKDHTNDPKE